MANMPCVDEIRVIPGSSRRSNIREPWSLRLEDLQMSMMETIRNEFKGLKLGCKVSPFLFAKEPAWRRQTKGHTL